jgi:ATP-dependent RNA helicase DeaD
MSIAIVTRRDLGRVKDIERKIGKQFTKALVPNGVDVTEKQLFNLVHKLHNVTVMDEAIEKFLPKIFEELNELTKEELIKRFISEEFNRFYTYYQNAPDLNDGDAGDSAKSRGARFFLNLGELDGLNPLMLKDYLAEISQIPARMIFNIDIKKSFSFFETEPKFKDQFLSMNSAGIQFNNRTVNFEVSAGRSGGSSGSSGRSYGNSRDGGSGKSYGGSSREGGSGRSYSGGGGGKSYGGSSREGGREFPRKRSESGSSDTNRESGGAGRFKDKFKKKFDK